MKKFLLITLLSIFGGNWAFAQKQDTLRIRVMTYNLRFGELASLEQSFPTGLCRFTRS